MRWTRRAFLAGASAALTGTGGGPVAAQQGPSRPVSIEIRSRPIMAFSAAEPERRDFGALTFVGGLELTASQDGFGGFSGLWLSPDGSELVALSDRTQWLTAHVLRRDGRLAGLANAVMAPVLGADGRPLRRTRHYDSEAFTISGGLAYVAFERSHDVMRFEWGKEGVRARGALLRVPPEVKRLPRNEGLEAIGIAPPRHPLAGALIAIAERAREGDGAPTRGFILTGPRIGAFDVVRSDGFDITDLAFLPSGDMLLLERRFSYFRGVASRLRRIPAAAIAPGATVDGPVVFSADAGHQIDNMEGLAVRRDASGATVLSMISDDNFSALQRTVLLEFTLDR